MFNFLAEKLNVGSLSEVLAPKATVEEEFHQAIEYGMLEKVSQLLDEGVVNENTLTKTGNKPIHTAAYHNQEGIIDLLLSRGVDVDDVGARDNTALHYAASQGHLALVKMLVGRGSNPARRNRAGRTAYDVAGDHHGVRQYLLPLQFQREDPSEAARLIPAGITPSRDPREVLAVAPPPPSSTMSGYGAPPAVSVGYAGQSAGLPVGAATVSSSTSALSTTGPTVMASPASPAASPTRPPSSPASTAALFTGTPLYTSAPSSVAAPSGGAGASSVAQTAAASAAPPSYSSAGSYSRGQAGVTPAAAASTSSSSAPGGGARKSNAAVFRKVRADGFGTSVGNPELTAKYGNTRTVTQVAGPPPSSVVGGTAQSYVGLASVANPYSSAQHPYARGRYTTYDPVTNTGQAFMPPQYGAPVVNSTTVTTTSTGEGYSGGAGSGVHGGHAGTFAPAVSSPFSLPSASGASSASMNVQVSSTTPTSAGTSPARSPGSRFPPPNVSVFNPAVFSSVSTATSNTDLAQNSGGGGSTNNARVTNSSYSHSSSPAPSSTLSYSSPTPPSTVTAGVPLGVSQGIEGSVSSKLSTISLDDSSSMPAGAASSLMQPESPEAAETILMGSNTSVLQS